MPGDSFKKVLPGQRLEISADFHNATVDAIRATRLAPTFGADSIRSIRDAGIIKVRNMSGANRGQFDILALDAPIIVPSGSDAGEWSRQVAFDGVVPSGLAHVGRFAVLLEPVVASGIGAAVVSGVTHVRLQVDDAGLAASGITAAEILHGDATRLKHDDAGSVRVIWAEASGTERKAIVRLEKGGGAGSELVRVTNATPDAEGFYTAFVQEWVSENTYTDAQECFMRDANA